jgi:hypothetical protein
MATDYGLDVPGSIAGSAKFFSYPKLPNRLWGSLSLNTISTGLFLLGQSVRAVELTIHLHLVPKSRRAELYLHSPICLNDIAHKLLSTGTTLYLHFYALVICILEA